MTEASVQVVTTGVVVVVSNEANGSQTQVISGAEAAVLVSDVGVRGPLGPAGPMGPIGPPGLSELDPEFTLDGGNF